MSGTSHPARTTSTRTNRLLSHPQKNTEACDELRRRIQMQASPALVESLASTAEVSLNSVYHQIEGGQKLSGDLIVALLKHLPTHEIEDAVNAAIAGTRFRIVLLPAAASIPSTSLLQATAPVMSSAGRLAEVVALASADGEIDDREARQIEVECCRQCETAGRVADRARRMAS